MRIKERLLAHALAAVLRENGISVILHDEAGSFHFHMNEDTGALHLDQIEDGDIPIKLGPTLIVKNDPPEKERLH